MPYSDDKMMTLIKSFQLPYKNIKSVRWIDLEAVKKSILIEPKYEKLIDLDSDDIKVIADVVFIKDTTVYNLIKLLKSHPEHHNMHKIVGLIFKFKKQQEVTLLASIYREYRNKYTIHYQYAELEFKLDGKMVIEVGQTGGIVFEIDENNHGAYDKKDHEDRQKILESCGYHFIRIKPDELTEEELLKKVEIEINNYQLVYSKDIDPEMLWTELKHNGIDQQFFKIIGKSIVCCKKYCVDFDDIVDFVGYSRKDHAKRFLLENLRNGIDYIMNRKSELEERDDVLLPNWEELKNSNNKIYIYLTKFAFYSFVLQANTNKAKEIRSQVIDIYSKYHDLLMYCRQANIQKNMQSETDNAIRLYEERQKQKDDEYKKAKQREIKTMKGTITEIRKQKDDLKNQNITLKHAHDKYKKMYTQSEKSAEKNKKVYSGSKKNMTKYKKLYDKSVKDSKSKLSKLKDLCKKCPDKKFKTIIMETLNELLEE